MRNPQPLRHRDNNQSLHSYADEVWVRCVRCDASGVVRATWSPYRWDARFRCGQCLAQLSSAAGDWVGPVAFCGRRPCGHCGHKWLSVRVQREAAPAQRPGEWPALCPACGRTSQVAVEMGRVHVAESCRDPHFGLPLRLTTPTRHGTLWVYNPRHLAALSSYIHASLREHHGAHHYAMLSRLPRWMKLARNRAELANALARLEALRQG
ncbi:hypothetical protein [Leeia sp.]|uniref:hypothetical protein n=1 Tax=Leeia sp. TaxID=2884678 RepID=UPI0035B3446E